MTPVLANAAGRQGCAGERVDRVWQDPRLPGAHRARPAGPGAARQQVRDALQQGLASIKMLPNMQALEIALGHAGSSAGMSVHFTTC